MPHLWKPVRRATEHLVEVHGLQRDEAREQIARCPWYRMRKQRENVKLFHCTQRGCIEVVRNLALHLRRKHRLFASMTTDEDLEAVEATQFRKIGSLQLDFPDNGEPPAPQGIVSDNEEEPAGRRVEERIRGTKLTPLTWKMVKEFESHISGFQGGNLVGSHGYAMDVTRILQTVGGDVLKMTCLNLYKKFVRKQAQHNICNVPNKISPVTVRNRLRSLVKFAQFLLSEHSSLLDQYQILDNVLAISKRAPNWIKSMRKVCTMQGVKHRAMDNRRRLSLEDVVRYRNSEFALNAEKDLTQELVPYSAQRFVHCRNHILTTVCLGNANRSGILSSITIDMYRHAEVHSDDYVIVVPEHKTATSYGAATICISAKREALSNLTFH